MSVSRSREETEEPVSNWSLQFRVSLKGVEEGVVQTTLFGTGDDNPEVEYRNLDGTGRPPESSRATRTCVRDPDLPLNPSTPTGRLGRGRPRIPTPWERPDLLLDSTTGEDVVHGPGRRGHPGDRHTTKNRSGSWGRHARWAPDVVTYEWTISRRGPTHVLRVLR